MTDCECVMRGDWTGDPCHADGPDGTMCSRQAGHDGPHRACTPAVHPVVEWEQDRGRQEPTRSEPADFGGGDSTGVQDL